MTVDGSVPSATEWPIPKFRFEVRWDVTVMHFQEVSGLDIGSAPLEYRHGDSPQFSAVNMPGIKAFSDVTLKKGVFKSDGKFWDGFNEIKMNTIKRKAVTIRLLDEGGAPMMAWTLANAWPSKITGTDLRTSGNEVAVETLVISHEGLTIANG